MKKLFSSLLIAVVAIPMLGFAPTAKAASINTAIRGQSQQTVYWYAQDGKRYVFPNASTFYTWFPSFDSIQSVSDSELQSIPLGSQNVTFRPGAKLVKVTTDPKVYAVSRNAVLRHVTSESLASQLYGSDWRLKVNDVPDEFFANYTVGSPIYSVSDYNVGNEYNAVSYPHDSLKNGTGGSTVTGLNLTVVSRSVNGSEETITFEAWFTNTNFASSATTIRVYDETRSNELVHTCSSDTICRFSRTYVNGTSRTWYARATNSAGQTLESNRLTWTANGSSSNSGSLSFTADRTNITSGQAVYLNANYNQSLPTNGRIEIRHERTSNVIQTCYSTSCSITVYPTQDSGYSSVQYLATVKDQNGNTVATQYGPVISFTGTSTSNVLTLNADRASIRSGDAVTLTANLSGSLPNGGRIEIHAGYPTYSVNVLKTCYDTYTCSVTVNPTQTAGASYVQYRAIALNSQGAQLSGTTNVLSQEITFTDSSNGSGQNGDAYINGLVINTNDTSVRSGDSIRLTATAYNYGTWSYAGNRIEIRDYRDNSIVKTCYDSNTCAIDLNVHRRNSENQVQYEARIWDRNGRYVMNQLSQVIFFEGTGSGSGSDTNGYVNGLVLNSNDTSVRSGDTVRLTATAYKYGTLSFSGYRLEIRDMRDGLIVRTCYDQSTCATDVAVIRRSAETQAQYEARIYNPSGTLVMSQMSPVVFFEDTTTGGSAGGTSTTLSGNVTVELHPSSVLAIGNTVFVNADVTSINARPEELTIRIYDERSGTPIGTCTGSMICTASFYTGSSSLSTRIYTVVSATTKSGSIESNRMQLTTR